MINDILFDMVFLYHLIIIYMINLQTIIINSVLIKLMFINYNIYTFGLNNNNITEN